MKEVPIVIVGAHCDPIQDLVVVLERDASKLLNIKDDFYKDTRQKRSLNSQEDQPGEFDHLDQLHFEAISQ